MLSQNSIDIDATLDADTKRIRIYLNDWNHSFSSKNTPLATRFAEEFDIKFHFAKDEERGYTTIESIKDNDATLQYTRLKEHPDVIKVKLIEPLEAEGTYSLKLTYVVQLPFDKFTRYGYTDINDFKLRYWYITPALYDGEWQYYSNKNLNDLFTPKTDINISLTHPRNYVIASELDFVSLEQANDNQTVTLTGKDRVDSKLMLTKLPTYKSVQTDYFTIISNVETKNLSSLETVMVTDKITKFLVDNLGAYPHEKLLLTITRFY